MDLWGVPRICGECRRSIVDLWGVPQEYRGFVGSAAGLSWISR